MTRNTFLTVVALVLAFAAYSLPPPAAHAVDDDDSGDGVDCYPTTGSCDDTHTLTLVKPSEYATTCAGGVVEVDGDPHAFCYDDDSVGGCAGTCYSFSEAPGWVFVLVAN